MSLFGEIQAWMELAVQDFVALHTGYLLLAAAKSHYNNMPRILAYLIQPVLHLPADLS
jgi:hypothetical protein